MFSCLGQNPLYCLQWQGLAGGGGGLEHGGLLKHESDMVATPGACAHSGRSPSQCLQRQGLRVYGERPQWLPFLYVPLNNGVLLPEQSELPQSIPSCMGPHSNRQTRLMQPSSSPLPRSALQMPCFSIHSPPALVDTCLRQGCEMLWHIQFE